jgi:hypothetical protein
VTTNIRGNSFLTTNEILIVYNHFFEKLQESPHIKGSPNTLSLSFLSFLSLSSALSRLLRATTGGGFVAAAGSCDVRRLLAAPMTDVRRWGLQLVQLIQKTLILISIEEEEEEEEEGKKKKKKKPNPNFNLVHISSLNISI